MADQPPTKFDLQDVDKLGIASAVLQAILAASARIFSSPFKGANGANTYYKDIVYAALRTHLGSLSLAQDRYLAGTTTPAYHQYAISHKFTPASITLPSGTQAHWLGSPDAPKVLVYLHGGGYVLPASQGHITWLDDLQKSLGPSISALLLAYDLAPEATYPTQLRQAAELIQHLTETQSRSPADIILAGDSAGGNLALGVLSHIAHPHPDIAELRLNGKIHAALLISPWASLTQHHTPAHARNAERDMFDSRTLSRWSTAFLGSSSPFAGDFYSEPVLVGAEWWEGVAEVVEKVLIWGGENEILIEGIEAFARKFSAGFRRRGGHVSVIVTPGAAHEEMIFDRVVGYKGDSGTGSQGVVEEWVKAKL